MNMDKVKMALAKVMFDGTRRLDVYENIAAMTADGISLKKVIDMLWEQAARRSRADPTAMALGRWRILLKSGKPLSFAVGAWVPPGERMMIEAGEESRKLSHALDNLIMVVEGKQMLRSTVVKAAALPLLQLAGVVAVLWFFATEMVPSFEMMVPRAKWSGEAADAGALADFVRTGLLPLAGGVAAFGLAVFVSLPRWTGKSRLLVERMPPFSIYRLVVGAELLLAVAAMVGAGAPVTKVIEKMKRNATPYLEERLARILVEMRSGAPNLGIALQRSGFNFPDPEAVDKMVHYAGLKNSAAMIEKIGQRWMARTVKKVSQQAAILNKLGTALVAVVLGLIFKSFFALQGLASAVN